MSEEGKRTPAPGNTPDAGDPNEGIAPGVKVPTAPATPAPRKKARKRRPPFVL